MQALHHWNAHCNAQLDRIAYTRQDQPLLMVSRFCNLPDVVAKDADCAESVLRLLCQLALHRPCLACC